jgi:hypothetical protein
MHRLRNVPSTIGIAFAFALTGCPSGTPSAGAGAGAAESTRAVASAAPANPHPNAVEPSPASSSFGSGVSEATPFVDLAELEKSPGGYDGKVVRTRGEVVAVCQAAGCWADIRPQGASANAGPPAHLTMHQHAFFLPKNLKTRVAEVEGKVTVRALSQAEVDHYNGEGASLVAGAPMVTLDATGVAVR